MKTSKLPGSGGLRSAQSVIAAGRTQTNSPDKKPELRQAAVQKAADKAVVQRNKLSVKVGTTNLAVQQIVQRCEVEVDGKTIWIMGEKEMKLNKTAADDIFDVRDTVGGDKVLGNGGFSDEELQEASAELGRRVDRLEKGGLLIVHCKAGKSRSPAVVAKYMKDKHGWDKAQAQKLSSHGIFAETLDNLF